MRMSIFLHWCVTIRLLATLPEIESLSTRTTRRIPFLSVLIPAYNEQDRLGPTLAAYQDYLKQHPYWNADNKCRCQIVVCNDGSTDGTAKLVEAWPTKKATTIPVDCVHLPNNAGKGAALAAGMAHILQAKPNSWILTADADGSAPLQNNLEALLQRLEEEWYDKRLDDAHHQTKTQSPILVTGYRTTAAPSRILLRWGFRAVVRTIVGDLGVRDSQCGLKLLSPAAAAVLYRDLHLPSWSHDVEVLYRARALDVVVLEAPVLWQDQAGSHLVASGVGRVVARMFADVVQLKWCYATGRWTLPDNRIMTSGDV